MWKLAFQNPTTTCSSYTTSGPFHGWQPWNSKQEKLKHQPFFISHDLEWTGTEATILELVVWNTRTISIYKRGPVCLRSKLWYRWWCQTRKTICFFGTNTQFFRNSNTYIIHIFIYLLLYTHVYIIYIYISPKVIVFAVDGSELIWRLAHCLQFFLHPRWLFGISATK